MPTKTPRRGMKAFVLIETAPGKTKAVKLNISCPAACSFTIKVIKNGNVVAKLTSSLPAAPGAQPVSVPTTSAGKNLGAGPVTVKITTDDGTTTQTVTLS